MSKPWAIVPLSATRTEKDCAGLRRLAEHLDLIVVQDEDLGRTIQLVKELRKPVKPIKRVRDNDDLDDI